MPAEVSEQFFDRGIPVEIGKIHRELKKLWQNSDRVATRASRLNLVIYNAGESSLRANTALVAQIARRHALRAILIAAKPQYTASRVRAWINAHCQISKTGAKQRCSEQIAFQLEGEARDPKFAPNIIFSHLDSDLPLYLWRQGEFSDSPDETLMSWVDCLLFDSADWSRPAEQFAIIEKLAAAAGLESSLADLNWTRIGGLRLAVAQFFDASAARPALEQLESVEITHAPGARLTANLLVGWLAAQLGWKPHSGSGADRLGFRDDEGREISVNFNAREGSRIGRVELKAAGGAEFIVSREPGSDYYNTVAHCGADGREYRQMLPVGAEEMAELVSEELAYGGEHRCYRKALRLMVESQRLANAG
jgi:glucose-6-phosphate dehydrogenase assembly protein OpcA